MGIAPKANARVSAVMSGCRGNCSSQALAYRDAPMRSRIALKGGPFWLRSRFDNKTCMRMVTMPSVSELRGVIADEIRQQARLSPNYRREVIKYFICSEGEAVSEIGIAVEDALHIGRLCAGGQNVT
jgi:hypothetical protein